MDSLTQVVLGGAVAYAVMGNKVGRKAAIYGAVLGTLPDLDVLIPYGGAVENFTYHRGFSHSIFVHLLISPVIAYLLMKLHPATKAFKKSWFAMVFLCLCTHALLDSFTVYGTQLLWPFTEYPVGFSNLFIIDPLYTLPLLIAWVTALLFKQYTRRARVCNLLGLGFSCIYIVWTCSAKVYIDHKINIAFKQNNISYSVYESTPAPLTSFLWRAVAVQKNTNSTDYYEVYASIFDSPHEVSITKYPSQERILNNLPSSWELERLQWFTKGLYLIEERNNKVLLSDIRMGAHCYYVFSFALAYKGINQSPSKQQLSEQTQWLAGDFAQYSARPSLDKLSLIIRRIGDPTITLSPSECNNELKLAK